MLHVINMIRCGGSVLERSSCIPEIGVRSQVATDQVVKTGSDRQLHCHASSRQRRECHGSSEITIINGRQFHGRCGTLKSPQCSIAKSAKHRIYGDVTITDEGLQILTACKMYAPTLILCLVEM